jgi:hypothetical protein
LPFIRRAYNLCMNDFSEHGDRNSVQNDNELHAQRDPLCWRDHVLDILSASSGLGAHLVRTVYAEPYYGRTACKWGYSYCFEYHPSAFVPTRGFIMLSRTHVAKSETEARMNRPTLDRLLYELKNQVSRFPREAFGTYHPELDVPGNYGTLECCGEGRRRFYFMISQSGRMKPYWGFSECFQGMTFC